MAHVFPPINLPQGSHRRVLAAPARRIATTCAAGAGTSSALRKNPALYNSQSAPPTPQTEGSASARPPSTPQQQASDATTTTSNSRPLRKPEVLSPAGGWPQLRAAVENGADAVYFGVGDLNARARASNFTHEELPEVMEYLHTRGVKGYQVLNVLVFDDELEKLAHQAQLAAAAGVDAVIVQSVGAVEVIQKAAPSLKIHGSTQMSITSAEGAKFAASLGVERIVVGRELSVSDIASVSSTSPAEVEAFVHGALCVSYSGQCFSSEAWGGRSANRGQCAQACRLDYGLLVDGQLQAMGDVKYLLSPQDLAAVELVPDLIQAGVVSLKIEGRLKGPEYVAMTTRVYRDAVDAAWRAAEKESKGAGGEIFTGKIEDAAWRDLQQVFARGQDGVHSGLTPGFLEGPQHQNLVQGRSPRHRGVFLGELESVSASGAVLRLAAPLRRGDGIVFDQGDPRAPETGGNVYEVRLLAETEGAKKERGGATAPSTPARSNGNGNPNGSSRRGGGAGRQERSPGAAAASQSVLEADRGALVELRLGPGSDFRSVRPGQLVWKNKDPVLDSRLRASYEGLSAAQRRRLPVHVIVDAALGAPLRITLVDGEGRRGVGETDMAVEPAAARPLSPGDIEKAVGQHLGDAGSLVASDFDLSGCDFAAGLFVAGGAIKEARRRAATALLQQQTAAPSAEEFASPAAVLDYMFDGVAAEGQRWAEANGPRPAAPTLRVLCRTKAQVNAAVAVPWLTEIVCDFLEVHGLKEAVETVRRAGKRVVVAAPRILKPDERRLWLFYLRLGADALLVRSSGLLQQLMEAGGPGAMVDGHAIPRLEGDFSLNAENVVSVDLLLKRGLDRLSPTHDCNADQLAGIARGLGPRSSCLEAILHQNLPVFHTEHCVFARFLSDGNSFLDCGKPCEHHTVHLRAATGVDHLVLADLGCRNTVFEGVAQSGLPFVDQLATAGFGCFRIELVDQPPEVVAPLLEGYRAALEESVKKRGGGQGRGRYELWDWMQRELPDKNGRVQGVGTGSLQPREERSAKDMKPTAAATRAALAAEEKGGKGATRR